MSLDDRLDAVLHRSREPEPADDGFTDGVMTRVRGETNRRWRRYLTRPAILAAAAVLVTGGAFAAVRQAEPEAEEETGAETPVATVRAGAEAAATTPDPAAEREARVDGSARGASQDGADEQPVHRRDGYEWGYTSEHTSYVLHLDSGLRLETETHTNAFAVNEPQEVTLTLENTGDEPIGVSSEGRCPLVAFAGRAEGDEGEDPSVLPDPTAESSSQAKVRNCAERGGEEQPSEEERFALAPGETRVERSVVVLPERDDWAIATTCRCRWATLDGTTESEPTPTPEEDEGLLPVRSRISPDEGADDDRPSKDRDRHRTSERSGHGHGPDPRFVTPPIRVEAS